MNITTDTTHFSHRKMQIKYLCIPLVSILCFLLWNITCIRSDFSSDDADPEVLYQAWRMAQGQEIYRDINTPPFAFAAYPPLYFVISALILKFTGLSFLPGRLVSFIAVIFIFWAMVRLSRIWKRSGWIGLYSAFILLLIPAFLYNSVRCHPQLLAVAFSIWAFVFFIQNRWQYTIILSPILTLFAIYTKQTQIALPLAMILYLIVRNRKLLWPYVSVLTIGGLIPFLLMQKNSDGYFYSSIITYAGNLSYNVLDIAPVFIHHAGPVFIFAGIALLLLVKRFRNRKWEEIDYYLLVVFIFTLISLGRIGAHGQYVVELLVVILIYLIRVLTSHGLFGKTRWIYVQILILFIYTPLFIFFEEGLHSRAANRSYHEIYSQLEAASGPILSQQGSFPLFVRGEIYIQLFHFTGLFRAGAWDQKYLLDEIEKQTFSYVITEFPISESAGGYDGWERFTPEVLEALRTDYKFMRKIDPYYIYQRFSEKH